MAVDLMGIVEMELAKALRDIDRACMIAVDLEKHLPENLLERMRAKETLRRARKVRETLFDAGIRLPPLRRIGEWKRPAEWTHDGGDTESVADSG